MKQCQGDCNRYVQEYYVMPDEKVLCYDCWKRGIEHAERALQSYQSRLDSRWSAQQEYDNVGAQIQALTDKIKYEKQQAGTNFYPDNVEDYASASYIPYNYAKVKSLERDLVIMKKKRGGLEPRTHLYSPRPISVQYYRQGKYYNKIAAEFLEKKEKENAIRAEKERIQKENERFERLKKGQITNDDILLIKASPNDYLPKITNKNAFNAIARESTNNEVLAYLMNSESEEVLIALSDNPNLSAHDLSLLYDKGPIALKKHIKQSAIFHDLLKYRFLRLEEKGEKVDSSYLPLIEEMYSGNTCLDSGYQNGRWTPEKLRATDHCMTTLVKNTKNKSCWRRILKEKRKWRLALLDNPNLTEKYIEELASDGSVVVLEALINNPKFSPKAKQLAKKRLKAVRMANQNYTGHNERRQGCLSSGCCIWFILFVSISLVVACSLL